MKLASCAYSYRDLLTKGRMTLEDFLDEAVNIGLDGVDLTAYYFPETTPQYLRHIKREAFARGLDISGTAVGGNFSQADEAGRRKQLEHVKAWLGHSAALGSSVMRVFAGGQVEGAPRATAEDYVRDGLAECAKVAADCGVILALENHGGLTGDADGILALVEPFADNPWVGINLDFGNFAENNYEQYQRCLPHTVTTHCKVTHRLGGEKERVDYRRVVRLLRDGGYDGYLSIEYEEPEDPIAGVSRFAAYLRGCIVDA